MWDSAAQSAGVFEFDRDAGHFYLYKTTGQAGQKITGAIHIVSGMPDFAQGDVSVRWTPDESAVGLFIRGQLWAAFNCKTSERYGGNYRAGGSPTIPSTITELFKRE